MSIHANSRRDDWNVVSILRSCIPLSQLNSCICNELFNGRDEGESHRAEGGSVRKNAVVGDILEDVAKMAYLAL